MRRVLALLILAAGPVLANDGFGGLSATGLTFGQTEAVVMEEEDLFLSVEQVRVAYVFRNRTAEDVTGEVIFPLPPVSVGGQIESAWNLPEDRAQENLVSFTATVDGTPIAVTQDRIAVIEPPWDEARPLAAAYDTPGRDVTADLKRLGLPLTTDGLAAAKAMLALDEGARAEVVALGLGDFYSYEGESGPQTDAYPYWSIVLRYHWTQTFPAGARVRIAHDYANLPPGGLFTWEDPPQERYHADEQARYCIDAGTSKAIAKAIRYEDAGETYYMGMAWNISYVLRTANSWAGPIGKFRLTLDKGAPGNVISLCADGVRKTGPTTFVVEKTNYSPEKDLEILVVKAMERN